MKKLLWNTIHKVNFNKEYDYLETILSAVGIKDIESFLNVNINHTYNPFLFRNMKEGLELLHRSLGKKIVIKVDSDADGHTSSAYKYQFIKDISPETEIICKFNFKKEHGLIYKDVEGIEDLSLIIVPDAGSSEESIKEYEEIKNNINVPILILDHHEICKDIYNCENVTLINCMDGQYPNSNLSGVGVVHKFCLAYCDTYNIDKKIANKYLDLVALGMVADMMDMRELETRYYTLEGLKEENKHNLLIKEMTEKYAEEMKLGNTITSFGWSIAPKINATCRYGKDDEQKDLFRALIGEVEDREYQPRRKNKNDLKPPIEIHSLQKTMARVAGNVKARQDKQVRTFMEEIDKQIIEQKLENDKVIILDGTDILEKKSVSGLVANKLVYKYNRPIVILKRQKKNSEIFGGSIRGYEKGSIKDFRQFLEDTKLFEKVAGHSNAAGIELKQDRVQIVRDKCNELLKNEEIITKHDVDYEISADKLSPKNILEVANAYQIWGNKVNEPTFAITNIDIVGKDIVGYGDNNIFIKFTYRDIEFIKKYCSKGEYAEMSLRDRNMLGENLKLLRLTVIGNFVFNEWSGVKHPQVKIKYYHVEERKSKIDIDIDDIF